MIQSTNSRLVSRKRLVIPINLSARVIGAFYAVYGLAAALELWRYAQSGHPSSANIFAGLILVAFALFGLALTLNVESFSVDPTKCEYDYRRGIAPFAKSQTGSFGAIRAIVVKSVARAESDGEIAHSTSGSQLVAEVEWIDRGHTPVTLFTASERSNQRPQASLRQRATQIAEALGVPLDDRT